MSVAGANPVLGKDVPNSLARTIGQKAAQHTSIYANNNVKNMCTEWPGCHRWAATRANRKKTFRIIDAEVERRVVGWARQGAVWRYTLYVQTSENGQKKAYAFEQELDGNEWTYPAPSQIKKFPGHPNPNKPSKHIKLPASSSPQDTCKGFTACANWLKNNPGGIKNARFSQYANFNAQGDAVWSRDLYVLVQVHFEEKILMFHSYQTKPGGHWKHQASPILAADYPYAL